MSQETTTNEINMDICLSQKEWMELIRKCLEYLNSNPQNLPPACFREERYVLSSNFTETPTHFCYAFKGTFLPSGNLDGMVWKPSQGAKPNGKGLFKRYFYCKKDEVKINRQVIWLSENENWCFIDYRHNLKGKIRLGDVVTPEDFDFKSLLRLAWNPATKESLTPPSNSSSASSTTSKKRKEMDPPTSPSERTNQQNSKGSLHSTCSPHSQCHNPAHCQHNSVAPTFSSKKQFSNSVPSSPPPPLILSSPSSSLDLRLFPIDSSPFGMQSTLQNNIPTMSPSFSTNLDYDQLMYSSLDPLNDSVKMENSGNFGSGLEEFSDGSDNFFPSSPNDLDFSPLDNKINALFSPTPVYDTSSLDKGMEGFGSEPAPKKRKLNSTPSFFSSPLEYLFDMVSNKICVQILFKRQFFKRFEAETLRDYNSFLEKVKHQSVSVDLREFPAPIVRNFFGWVAEIFFHIRQDELPPLFCVVCGRGDGKHDELVHGMFYAHLDQGLVEMLQDKIMTVPDLCKALISFLLKNPDSHHNLSVFINQHLHCPFCACKKGIHRADRHEQWMNVFHIDPKRQSSSAPEPSPTGNVYESVKGTFSWLMGYVPVSIPPFLLSFHYVKYLQSFLDVLVTLWQTVRL